MTQPPPSEGVMTREKKESAHPARSRREEEKLDDAVQGSFPASDPLPTTPTSAGAPKREEDDRHPEPGPPKKR
jgi:hypothetical protein